MWSRAIVGAVCCLTGVVWILQGTDVISSSRVMSGHGKYTAFGIVLVVIGAALFVWAARIRQARAREGGVEAVHVRAKSDG